jgi:predicted nucleic acid-binding protein
MPVFVDSNVILDLVNNDPNWVDWSRTALEKHADQGLVGNGMVYAELCANAESPTEVDALQEAMEISILEIPRLALFRASKAHLAYRRSGGAKIAPLPDFFIGAHAEVEGFPVLTRDEGRYRTYFSSVQLICPSTWKAE